MLSKWQLWDFFHNVKRDYLDSQEGPVALSTFDPVSLKLAKDHLLRGISSKTVLYKMAPEVTRNWIEEEFQTLSLFGTQDSFFIHQAQDLSVELLEQLIGANVTGRFVLLSFESESAGWKKLQKEGKVPSLQIEPPKFWEPNKLLDFVCSYLRLPLSYEAKGWVLDSLENNLGTFYNAMGLVKLNYPEAREVGVKEVQELLLVEKLDQFALASLYCRRKRQEFLHKLNQLEGDFDKMRDFFRFMQGHLIKVMDPSYLAQKPRLSGYDKDIQSTARLWKPNELLAAIEEFNHWEILSKKKESLLWVELKHAYLRSLSRA
jgi:DNA polymerase III delta subunit